MPTTTSASSHPSRLPRGQTDVVNWSPRNGLWLEQGQISCFPLIPTVESGRSRGSRDRLGGTDMLLDLVIVLLGLKCVDVN